MKGISNTLNYVKALFLAAFILGVYPGLAQNELGSSNDSDTAMQEQVNINLADAETIAMILDGVGISRAEAIVDYRETNGEFKSLEELVMVSGIGEVTIRNNAARIILQGD